VRSEDEDGEHGGGDGGEGKRKEERGGIKCKWVEDVAGGRRDERTKEEGNVFFFFFWGLFWPRGFFVTHVIKKSFIMSSTVGDPFKSPTENSIQ